MHSPDLRPLAVAHLVVDGDVQRSVDQRRVDQIAEALNLDALGTITVSHRKNGSYHIIDGQHRVAAVRLAGGDDEKVMCRVFDGLTVAEEAEMFRLLNNTAKPTAFDIFRVRIVEGDPVAVAIEQILDHHGWRLSSAPGDGCIDAVASIERIYRLDPDAVEKTMATVTRAWGRSGASRDGRVVGGIGLVYARYGVAVDVAELVNRMARFAGGPAGLLGKARGLKEMIGGQVISCVAEITVETYNRGRKTRALPPWRTTH